MKDSIGSMGLETEAIINNIGVKRFNSLSDKEINNNPIEKIWVVCLIILVLSLLWWRIYCKMNKSNKKFLYDIDKTLVEQVKEIEKEVKSLNEHDSEKINLEKRFPLTQIISDDDEYENIEEVKKKKKKETKIERDMIYQEVDHHKNNRGPYAFNS